MSRFAGKNILITGRTVVLVSRVPAVLCRVMVTGRNAEALRRLPVSIDSVQNDGAQPEAAVVRANEVKAFGLLDGLWLNAGQRPIEKKI